MRTLLLNLTTSLDGFIADKDGGFDWLLPMPADVPQDYTELMETVDTFVMGRVTYETVLAMGGGYGSGGKPVFVFTSRTDLEAGAGVTIVNEPAETFVARLKEQEGGTIWLFGGGRLATSLSDAGLIDEYLIAVQPILLGDGIPLWRTPHARTRLEPTLARIWPGGVVETRWRRVE